MKVWVLCSSTLDDHGTTWVRTVRGVYRSQVAAEAAATSLDTYYYEVEAFDLPPDGDG